MMRNVFGRGGGQPDRFALMQRAALLLALYWRDKEPFKALLEIYGQEAIHEYIWTEPGNALPPGWCIYGVGTELLVVIRGTGNSSQWLRHIGGTWALKDPDGEAGVWVHMWHWCVANEAIWPGLKEILDRPPPGGFSKIRLIGHSYGAGIATLLARMIYYRFGVANLEVVTFGSPRVLATPHETTPAWEHYNVMGPIDVVTRMPPPWFSARAITSNVVSAVMARFGAGILQRFAGSQATGRVVSLPAWKHFGRGLIDLEVDGRIYWHTDTNEPMPRDRVPAWSDREAGHVMDRYYWPRLVQQAPAQGVRHPDMDEMIELVEDMISHPSPEDPVVSDWTAQSRSRWTELAQVMFPGLPPLTEDDFLRADQVEVRSRIVSREPSIGAVDGNGGGSMSTFKLTAHVSWGDNGRSVSIHKTGLADIASAKAAGLAWVTMYANFLGDRAGANPVVGGHRTGIPGAPNIDWLRVSDPLTARLGQRFRVPGGSGGGNPALSDDFASDIPWATVSLTILAQAGGRVIKDTVSIVGQPDKCIAAGGVDLNAVMQEGINFRACINRYLAFILPPNGVGFGTMGRDVTLAPDVPISDFTIGTDGLMTITADRANWLNMEYIRIIRCGVPYYAREWRVRLNEDGTYTLLGSRPAMAPKPAAGTGYRTRLENGNRQLTFYAYSEVAGSFTVDDRVFPSKRNPARVYSPLVSRRRRRTPAK